MNQPPLMPGVEAPVVQELNLEAIAPGTIARLWVQVISDGLGQPICIPVIVAKGAKSGKTLGLTAALHGNELNGIPIIQRLFRQLDPSRLSGTIIGIPVVNAPSFIQQERFYIDGRDLNHLMPGRPNGSASEVYAYNVFNSFVGHLDYLIDLHTASTGRINSFYVRADMNDPETRQAALLQNPQIIVHNPPSDGTLRGAATASGVCSITLELGDPNVFQKNLISAGLAGIQNLMIHLGMVEGILVSPLHQPVLCRKSYWLYADEGGILTVRPNLTEFLEKGQRIASVRNIFGDLVKTYDAPEAGIVIGKSVNPVNHSGGRILHLGVV